MEFILRFALFAAAHSLFAAKRIKMALNFNAPGEPRAYRLIYNLASMAMFGWLMAAYCHSPLVYSLPGPWKWILYTLQAVIAVVILQCVRRTGAATFIGISQLRSVAAPNGNLAVDGWYAHVRHPLYLFSTLFLILNPVMSMQWLLLTIFSIIYFIVGGIIEDRRLLEEFGEEYRDYRMRVPFIIPSLKSIRLHQ